MMFFHSNNINSARKAKRNSKNEYFKINLPVLGLHSGQQERRPLYDLQESPARVCGNESSS